jgi:hypothetical protein
MNVLLILVLVMAGNSTHTKWQVLNTFHTAQDCYAAKMDYVERTPAISRHGIFCCVDRGNNTPCKTI